MFFLPQLCISLMNVDVLPHKSTNCVWGGSCVRLGSGRKTVETCLEAHVKRRPRCSSSADGPCNWQQGWITRTRQVEPAGRNPDVKISFTSADMCEAGWRGERVSQSIWSRPTNSERRLRKNRADQGKRQQNVIWGRARRSLERPFEMTLCLVASLTTTEIRLVVCACVCV